MYTSTLGTGGNPSTLSPMLSSLVPGHWCPPLHTSHDSLDFILYISHVYLGQGLRVDGLAGLGRLFHSPRYVTRGLPRIYGVNGEYRNGGA